jgi:hypothetical protein
MVGAISSGCTAIQCRMGSTEARKPPQTSPSNSPSHTPWRTSAPVAPSFPAPLAAATLDVMIISTPVRNR